MRNREELLKIARGIEGTVVSSTGAWIGGDEVAAADAEGTWTVTVQDGSTEPDGPVVIPLAVHKRLQAAIEGGEEDNDDLAALEEEFADMEWIGDQSLEWDDVLLMVKSGCKGGVEYFWFREGEEFHFDSNHDALHTRWVASFADYAMNVDPWEDLATEEIEERLLELGLIEDET